MAITHDTRTVHTITVHLPDDVIGKIDPNDQVEVLLVSRALNRQPTPIRLSYTTVMRLTRDV